MTKRELNCGCLSESFERFLAIRNHQERIEKYGNDTNKFYEDIVSSVNQSFRDHLLVLSKLPEQYKQKIDFLSHCEAIKSSVLRNKRESEPILDTINETIHNLEFIRTEIINKRLIELAENDFE